MHSNGNLTTSATPTAAAWPCSPASVGNDWVHIDVVQQCSDTAIYVNGMEIHELQAADSSYRFWGTTVFFRSEGKLTTDTGVSTHSFPWTDLKIWETLQQKRYFSRFRRHFCSSRWMKSRPALLRRNSGRRAEIHTAGL